MAFDTTIFEEKEFRGALNKLEELLSHSKAVLLGAGSSACAGLPLANQLTNKALESDWSLPNIDARLNQRSGPFCRLRIKSSGVRLFNDE